MLSLISASDKLYRFIKQRYAEFGFRLGQLHITYYNCTAPDSQCGKSLIKATFHLTISMRGQRATGKIQRNNYHHGSYEPSLTGKTMSVFLIFTQGTHRNSKIVE